MYVLPLQFTVDRPADLLQYLDQWRYRKESLPYSVHVQVDYTVKIDYGLQSEYRYMYNTVLVGPKKEELYILVPVATRTGIYRTVQAVHYRTGTGRY